MILENIKEKLKEFKKDELVGIYTEGVLHIGEVSYNNNSIGLKNAVIANDDIRVFPYKVSPAYEGEMNIEYDMASGILTKEELENEKEIWEIRHHLRTIEDIKRTKKILMGKKG